jgi:hypothetical protein
MMKLVLILFAVIVVPAIWTTIIVPLIARSIGVPLRIGSLPIDRRDKRFSKRRSLWLGGVLGWGVGISLMGTLVAVFVDGTPPTLKLLGGVVSCCFVTALWTGGDWTYPLSER